MARGDSLLSGSKRRHRRTARPASTSAHDFISRLGCLPIASGRLQLLGGQSRKQRRRQVSFA